MKSHSFSRGTAVVVIDHDVPEKARLVRSAVPTADVVVLDATHDGLDQIASALLRIAPVAALHVVCHASDGCLTLGDAALTSRSIAAHADSLAAIAGALEPNAEVLLYGCEVARTETGKQFVDALAVALGASVAAAESKTGASALGGNWDLAYRTGPVETPVFLSPEDRRDYAHVLAAPHPFLVSTLDGDNGFKLTGVAAYDSAGQSVAALGDVNGDGFDDFVVGAFRASPNGLIESGATYVVFGGSEGFAASTPLSSLDGSNGFRLSGVTTGDRSGGSVSGGDFNGDGFADILIGARLADANGVDSGAAYVVFGKSSAFAANVDLTTLNGNDGFAVPGAATLQYAGGTISSAGDVNGDGYDDFLIAGPYGATSTRAYVVFGGSGGFPPAFDLDDLDGTNGFRVEAGAGNPLSSAAGAGDVNGDGYGDIVFGSGLSGANGTTSGAAYVLFGKSAGFAQSIDVSTLNFGEGFRLAGEAAYDSLGRFVSSAGDFNGDGIDDVAIGAPLADANGGDAGAVYIVYGRTTGFANVITIAGYGKKIVGSGANDQAGATIASAGDVNGDGFDDLIVGAQSGTFVVFGSVSGGTSDLSAGNIDGSNAFRIDAPTRSVSRAGDIDGDGFSDILLGNPGDDDIGTYSGAVYVIHGDDFTQRVSRLGTDEDDTLFGTTDDDNYLAEAGNDTILTGGGPDVVYAGSGDDVIHIAGADFKRIDGGPGMDTIALAGAGIVVDLQTVADNRVFSIEVIDLTGTGNNTVVLDTLDLLALNEGRRLRIDGDTGDRIVHASFWTPTGSLDSDGQTYQVYTRGPTTIEVDTDIALRFAGGNIGEIGTGVGFKLSGESTGDDAGYSVSGVGDVNGDGFDDFVVGAASAEQNGSYAGAAYVVFGKGTAIAADVLLSGVDGTDGFSILGATAGDQAGWSVSAAGDLNGDGFDDVLIGATGLDPFGPPTGGAYVVLGKASAFAASIDLADLDGSDGFRVLGEQANDLAGTSVAGAGDVNGDGRADFVVGAPRVDDGGTSTGKAYVVFGAETFSASANLGSLDGNTGFSLDGAADRSYTGQSVAGAGDVNGDGFADIIVGAPGIDGIGTDSGAAYVLFGKSDPFAAGVDLGALDGTNGFRLLGAAAYDRAGRSVAGAGDVNGDGFDDFIIGAYSAAQSKGTTYVVFGHAGAFDATVALGDIDGSNGFALSGRSLSGYSVASAGDVNGDGYDDVLVGEPRSSANGSNSGVAYVVFGKSGGFDANIDLNALDGDDGFRLTGHAASDELGRSVAAAGDIDGDGFDDIVIGARRGDGEAVDSGNAYVVFGNNFTGAVAYVGTTGNDTLTGTAAAERFLGGLGNDSLDGGGGDDHLDGGMGNDTYTVDSLGDVIVDDAGNDTVQSAVNFTLPDFLENLILSGAAHNSAVGNDQPNVLAGNTGNNPMRGNGGDDQLYGAQGYDTALFSGASSQYAFVDYLGTIRVADRIRDRDGVDFAHDVEQAFFDADSVTAVFTASDVFTPLEYIASYADLIAGFGINAALGYQHFVDTGRFDLRTAAFDGLEYVASHPDLIAGFGLDRDAATAHYIQSGRNEGRTVTFNGLEYIASYNDLINSFGVNEDLGTSHYLAAGRNEGRAVSFRGLEYLASNPDLMAGYGTNFELATIHYIQSGRFEGRNADFNGLEYIASYADLIQGIGANRDAGTLHYINAGRFEGRTVSFDPAQYLANYADLAAGFGNNHDLATLHYIQHGFSEGRTDQPL